MAKEKQQQEKMNTHAMMEVYKKLGTPGPQHGLLAGMAGSWTTKTSACNDPIALWIGGRDKWQRKSL